MRPARGAPQLEASSPSARQVAMMVGSLLFDWMTLRAVPAEAMFGKLLVVAVRHERTPGGVEYHIV